MIYLCTSISIFLVVFYPVSANADQGLNVTAQKLIAYFISQPISLFLTIGNYKSLLIFCAIFDNYFNMLHTVFPQYL